MRTRFLAATLLMASLTVSGRAHAQNTFVGGTYLTGSLYGWDTASNWSLKKVPSSGSALIDGFGVIKGGGSITLDSLALNDGADLILDGSTTVSIANFTFGNTGSSTTHSSIGIGYIDAGSLTINSGTTLSGNIGTIGSPPATPQSLLTNNGVINGSTMGNATNIYSMNFINNGVLEATNGNSLSYASYSSSAFTNNGSVNVSGGGSMTIQGSFINNGVFNIAGGVFNIGVGSATTSLTGSNIYNVNNSVFNMSQAILTGVSIKGINSNTGILSGILDGTIISGFQTSTITSNQILGGLTVKNGSSIDAASFVFNDSASLFIVGSDNHLSATTYTFGNTGGNTVGGGISLTTDFTVNLGTVVSGNIRNLSGSSSSTSTLTNYGLINSNFSGTTNNITGLNLINYGTIQSTNGANMGIGANGFASDISNNGTLGVSGGGSLTIASGSSLVNNGIFIIGTNSTALIQSNLNQISGKMIADGTISVSSGVTVQLQGGMLTGVGSIGGTGAILNNTGATISAGDAGVGSLVINGAYQQSGIGSLLVDLGGTSPGAFDFINVNGTATLGGNLYVDLLSGFTPTVGQTFTFMTYGSRVGNGTFTIDSLNSGYDYSVTYGANSATLMVTKATSGAAAPEPAVLLLVSIGLPTIVQGYRRRKSITRTH